MRQIDLKEYPKRFLLSGLPIVKVGINFDVEQRNNYFFFFYPHTLTFRCNMLIFSG